jgi:hypothetical protein
MMLKSNGHGVRKQGLGPHRLDSHEKEKGDRWTQMHEYSVQSTKHKGKKVSNGCHKVYETLVCFHESITSQKNGYLAYGLFQQIHPLSL